MGRGALPLAQLTGTQGTTSSSQIKGESLLTEPLMGPLTAAHSTGGAPMQALPPHIPQQPQRIQETLQEFTLMDLKTLFTASQRRAQVRSAGFLGVYRQLGLNLYVVGMDLLNMRCIFTSIASFHHCFCM